MTSFQNESEQSIALKNIVLQPDERKERKWSRSVVSNSLDPMNFSPPGSSVHGIFQARILEWVAISFSSRSSRPRNRTRVSCISGRCFTIWATREAQMSWVQIPACSSTSCVSLGKFLSLPVPQVFPSLNSGWQNQLSYCVQCFESWCSMSFK